MEKAPIGLYIHLPFCVKKCNYCAFTSVVANDEDKKEYVNNLLTEIRLRAKELSGTKILNTIYIGGGTPSSLPAGEITKIMDTINKNFSISSGAEITIECNPSSLTKEKAKEYISAGINRFSLGLQSAQNSHLKTLGRLHTADTFKNAVEILHSLNVKNINGDLMLGIPNQTKEDVVNSVKFLAGLNVQHISIYMLELEGDTPFKKLYDNNMLPLPTDEETIELYNIAKEMLEKFGFNRYEVSNFAKLGFESKHNKNYWARGEYLGVGASAESFINGFRFGNTKDIKSYNSYVSKEEIPLEYKEKVTTEEALEETVMLSLRTENGLNLETVSQEFVKDNKDKLKSFIKDGLLVITKNNHLKATDKGFAVLDYIIENLI